MEDTYQLIALDRHRNGISGEPFHVVLFVDPDNGMMVANVFEKTGYVAVLNVPMLVDGNIAFARGNSWRGDHYESWLREQIAQKEMQDERDFQARYPYMEDVTIR